MYELDENGLPTIAYQIFTELSSGKTLKEICEMPGMPTRETVYQWNFTNKTFSDMYTRAKEMQADVLVDQILTLGDEEWTQQEKDNPKLLNALVQHRRLRVDSRKWFAAKVLPKRYGDKAEDNTTDGNKEAQTEFYKSVLGKVEDVCKNLPRAADDTSEEIID